MLVVLAQRILKATFFPVDNLRPMPGFGIAENPSAVILGFDNKDAIPGHDNMIYLRRTKRRIQSNVVKHCIFTGRQFAAQDRIDSTFASRALDRGRLEVSREQNDYEKQN